MSGTPNKIKYGLKGVYYAKITALSSDNVPTYSAPVAWPGAVNLSMSPEGEATPFYADNIEYWKGSGNQGYTGTLESALIPDSFKTDILGEVADSKGVIFEDANAATTYFALLFQFEGDQNATRHILYKCSATRPNTEGSTKEDNVTPQTETVNIAATPIYNATLETDIVKARTNEDTDSTTYSGWYTAVTLPTAAGGQ